MHSNGHIFQINLSRGGVPKRGIPTAEITGFGIVGDAHRDKRYHGGPDRAICLYSLERIMALQEEGHPIFPGSIGENIITAGIDLGPIEPGARLALGDGVEIEIASYTVPCRTIRASFLDEHFNRISQKLHPGWSRLYARVLREGSIRVGDRIAILS
jgi:MOSC domain-containing protein YiiM